MQNIALNHRKIYKDNLLSMHNGIRLIYSGRLNIGVRFENPRRLPTTTDTRRKLKSTMLETILTAKMNIQVGVQQRIKTVNYIFCQKPQRELMASTCLK